MFLTLGPTVSKSPTDRYSEWAKPDIYINSVVTKSHLSGLRGTFAFKNIITGKGCFRSLGLRENHKMMLCF